MTNYLDFNVSSIDTIALTPEQIMQAAQMANSLSELEQQWINYLNNLALIGFESWLSQRMPEIILNQDNNTSISNAICQLEIGDFKICLLTQGTLDDEMIAIPSQVIDIDRNTAHFYVLITVDEEQEEVSITAIIRYDQLRNYQRLNNLRLQSNQTYLIPLTFFDNDVNHLFLYLRCLEPSAIQLPNTLTEPENPSIINQLRQPVVNVALWLQNQLDTVAESLSLLLLSDSQLATASFRSLQLFELVIQQLVAEGLSLPEQVGRTLLEFKLGEIDLQLYCLAWLLENSQEWSILLILGTPNDRPLPTGLKLNISDETSLVSEQEIDSDNDQTYLYSRIVAEINERLTVSIALGNEEILTLPAFTFFSEPS
jgi:Protein of unknown function (DUF1822)